MPSNVRKNQRTLIRQSGTYMVSLPKDFIIDLGWRTGDKILVERNDHSVVLKAESPIIFSLGYEGKTIGSMLQSLKSNEITDLVDVRNHPFSWNKNFSEKILKEALEKEGISYVNFPKLGAPKNMRIEIKENGNREKFFSEYSDWLDSNKSYLDLLDIVARKNKTAIMCLEADYHDCHRSIIEKRLKDRGYEVIHL